MSHPPDTRSPSRAPWLAGLRSGGGRAIAAKACLLVAFLAVLPGWVHGLGARSLEAWTSLERGPEAGRAAGRVAGLGPAVEAVRRRVGPAGSYVVDADPYGPGAFTAIALRLALLPRRPVLAARLPELGGTPALWPGATVTIENDETPPVVGPPPGFSPGAAVAGGGVEDESIPAAAAILAGLAAGAVPLLAGWPLSCLLPRAIRRALVARGGAAWLLGAAWCGAVALAASHLGGVPLRRGVLLPLVLAPLAAALVFGRRRLVVARPKRPAPVSVVAGSLGLLTCAVLLFRALASPVAGWDGLMTWTPQARLMREERTATPAAFRDPRVWVSHPQYPPLVSLVQVTGLEIVGAPVDERPGRVVFPLFFAAFLALLHRTVRLLARSARAAAVAAALAATTPFLAFSDHGGAAGVYADVPLAALLGGAFAVLLCGGLGGGAGLAGGLLLASAALTKNEGVPLASGTAVLVLIVAVAGSWGRTRAVRRARALRVLRTAVAAAALLGASGALVHGWRAGIPNRYDEDYGALLAGTRLEAATIAGRFAAVTPSLVSGLVDVKKWGLLWPALFVLALVRPGDARRRVALAAAGLLLGPVAVALAAYAVSWNPLSLADVTWDRFLVQGAFGTFLLAGLLAAGGLQKLKT